MIRPLLTSLALALACASLGACANLTSVHRIDPIFPPGGGGQAILIDAKQRAILTNRVGVALRICSEAPPDAFTALSAGGSGDIGTGGADAADLKARGALAISESAASFERTQTVNLLRESMYRTCERFMSGAIDEDEFIIQAARDQRAMVAILAIEQLTGVIRAPSTVISAGAASAAYSDPSAFFDAVKRAEEDKNRKDTEAVVRQRAYDEASTGASVSCDPKPAPPITDPKILNCLARKDERDTAKRIADAANEHLVWVRSVADRQVANMTASSGAGAIQNAGGLSSRPDAATTEVVAKEVKDIVKAALDFPEVQMMCMLRIRKNPTGTDLLTKECIKLVALAVRGETQRLSQSMGARFDDGDDDEEDDGRTGQDQGTGVEALGNQRRRDQIEPRRPPGGSRQ